MRVFAGLILAGLVLSLAAAEPAQVLDPLTPGEADQIRSTAGHPDQRIPLLLQFAEARLTHFEQIRTASPRPPDRDAQLYGLLREYKAILPEIDAAADDLAQGYKTSESSTKKYNAPKVFDDAIATLERLDATLHHIQTASTPADLATYHFALDDCLDVTSDSLQNAQEDRAQAGKVDTGR